MKLLTKKAVARAIFTSTIPVISAVGHETDFYNLQILIADLRVLLQQDAAELAVPYISEIAERLTQRRYPSSSVR